MTEIEYSLKLPQTEILFNETEVTFSINYVKSRQVSVLYFKFHCFNRSKEKIWTYTSPRWVVDTEYRRRSHTFNLPLDIRDKTVYTQVELRPVGITSENPLYFAELMLNEGDDIGYHIPNENLERSVGFVNNAYVNLYSSNGNYLQVIRPKKDGFTTNQLSASTCTVLAPHLEDESDIDDPVNIFMEFLNQTDQSIDVLR